MSAASGTLPETQVQAMFDRIARVYDRMNGVMTVGMHHRWRERAADLARVGPGSRALDVATGTGDLALALRRDGSRWRIETPRAVVHADKVLLATNGFTDDLWPALRRTIVPVFSSIAASSPLSDDIARSIMPAASRGLVAKRTSSGT